MSAERPTRSLIWMSGITLVLVAILLVMVFGLGRHL